MGISFRASLNELRIRVLQVPLSPMSRSIALQHCVTKGRPKKFSGTALPSSHCYLLPLCDCMVRRTICYSLSLSVAFEHGQPNGILRTLGDEVPLLRTCG